MPTLEGPQLEGHGPRLRLPRVRRPRALALVLHGGQPDSLLPVVPADPAVLRALPFAYDVEARSRGRVGGVVLQHAVRGWNGDTRSPVVDAEWALMVLQQRYPGLPIGLIGHSMGGRTSFELAAHPAVRSIASLAPWLSDAYAAGPFVGTPLLVMHGEDDGVTSAASSRDLVRRVVDAGGQAQFRSMAGGHTMTRRPLLWHRCASRFTLQHLLNHPSAQQPGDSPPRLAHP